MGQIEVLYELRNYASYFTASELPIPEYGYGYTGFITSLLTNPDQSTAAYLNVIVSTYRAKYMTNVSPTYYMNIWDTRGLGYPTLAAINSSQLPGVVSGLDALSNAIIQGYRSGSRQFNITIVQALAQTLPRGEPRLDIRGFAQNLLLYSQVLGSNITSAANALVLDLKAAVIANTTLPVMYEGLTVTLPYASKLSPGASVNGVVVNGGYMIVRGSTSLESQFSFANTANWVPLLQSIFRSFPSGVTETILTLQHSGHELYLNVYNSTGGHTGFNPALLNYSRDAIALIPGTFYFDFGNGTTMIALPPSMQNFSLVVDGTFMEEASENYTLTYTVVQNGTVTSTKTVEGNISQYTRQSAYVMIQNGTLNVGAPTVTTTSSSPIVSASVPNATSYTTSSSGSSIATSFSSSSSSPVSTSKSSSSTSISWNYVVLVAINATLFLTLTGLVVIRKKN